MEIRDLLNPLNIPMNLGNETKNSNDASMNPYACLLQIVNMEYEQLNATYQHCPFQESMTPRDAYFYSVDHNSLDGPYRNKHLIGDPQEQTATVWSYSQCQNANMPFTAPSLISSPHESYSSFESIEQTANESESSIYSYSREELSLMDINLAHDIDPMTTKNEPRCLKSKESSAEKKSFILNNKTVFSDTTTLIPRQKKQTNGKIPKRKRTNDYFKDANIVISPTSDDHAFSWGNGINNESIRNDSYSLFQSLKPDHESTHKPQELSETFGSVETCSLKFSNSQSAQALIEQGLLKAKRRRASPEQTAILAAYYHQTNGFPSTKHRIDLAKQLRMTPRAIQIWFQNKRQCAKKEDSMEDF